MAAPRPARFWRFAVSLKRVFLPSPSLALACCVLLGSFALAASGCGPSGSGSVTTTDGGNAGRDASRDVVVIPDVTLFMLPDGLKLDAGPDVECDPIVTS